MRIQDWLTMGPVERETEVANALHSDEVHSYSTNLSDIATALKDKKIPFEIRVTDGHCIAMVGTGNHSHTAVMSEPAAALSIAFLRFMGHNVKTVES